MKKTTVSKQSLRELLSRQRLPSSLHLFLSSSHLYQVLEANGLEKKFKLWNLAYQAQARQVNQTQMTLKWHPVA